MPGTSLVTLYRDKLERHFLIIHNKKTLVFISTHKSANKFPFYKESTFDRATYPWSFKIS